MWGEYLLMSICFLLLIFAPSAFSDGSADSKKDYGPIMADGQCPVIPVDVHKKETGKVCYRGAENPGMPKMYSFYGEKIAGEPDSKVYKVIEFYDPSYLQHGRNKTFAVKVVSTGHLARSLHLAKPEVMIRHELNMLNAFNGAEKESDQKSVVKLFEGGEVVDHGFMDNPLNLDLLHREFSIIYVMEFGEKTLDRHLKDLGQKWNENMEQYTDNLVQVEMKHLLEQLFQTVANFHKYALHLHLKPGNWIYVKNQNKWKLIDLQSAIPRKDFLLDLDIRNNYLNTDALFDFEGESSPDDIVEFACNSLGNEVLILTKLLSEPNERPTTYASPEHAHACEMAHPLLKKHFYDNWFTNDEKKQRTMNEQLAKITPKSDVWSMGMLILELLAYTPQLNPKLKRKSTELFMEMRSEWVGDMLKEGLSYALKIKEFVHFRGRRERMNVVEGKNIKLGMHMKKLRKHFPVIFDLLTKIFVADPSERANLDQLLKIVRRQTLNDYIGMRT